MIKKALLSSSLILLLNGCSVSQNVYDNIKGANIFNDNFEYQVKNLNTLDDNILLRSKIEKDKEIMNIIHRSKNVDDLNYQYYKSYQMLLSVIKIESSIINDNDPISQKSNNFKQGNDDTELFSIVNDILKDCKQDKVQFISDINSFKTDYSSFFESNKSIFQKQLDFCYNINTNKKIVNNTNNSGFTSDTDTSINNKKSIEKDNSIKDIIISDKLIISTPKDNSIKDTIISTSKNSNLKKEQAVLSPSFNIFGYNKNGFDKNGCSVLGLLSNGDPCNLSGQSLIIYNNFISVKIHCNVEDSYLLKDDITLFKHLLDRQDKELKGSTSFYSSYYKDELNRCENILNSNKFNLSKEKDDKIIISTTPDVFYGYSKTALDSSVSFVSSYLFELDDNLVSDALKEYSNTVFKIDRDDNLKYFNTVEYNGQKYFIFSNEDRKFQIYYPYDKSLKFDKTIPIFDLFYSIFDYGYIDEYKTLILNNVSKL